MFNWVKELLDKESRSLGVYLALLHMLIFNYHYNYNQKPSIEEILDDAKKLYALYFAGRGSDLKEALEAGRRFLTKLFEDNKMLENNKRNQALISIEAEFYSDFVKAFKKYLRLDLIPDKYRDKVFELLIDVRAQLYDAPYTHAGTFKIWIPDFKKKDIAKRYGISEQEVNRILEALERSGLAIKYGDYYIFPAPCLSDEILELVKSPRHISTYMITAKQEAINIDKRVDAPFRLAFSKYTGKTPSREILESIVADVLRDLGFNVRTNVRLSARGGKAGDIEVDVWAYKPEVKFYVYASCKNWDKEVDASEIDREFGRVNQLDQIPHLKIFVAKRLTEPARARALADGFIVIELGEKATTSNAEEIYKLIYTRLKALFYGIAPPELQRLAKRTKELAEELKRIAEEMEKL